MKANPFPSSADAASYVQHVVGPHTLSAAEQSQVDTAAEAAAKAVSAELKTAQEAVILRFLSEPADPPPTLALTVMLTDDGQGGGLKDASSRVLSALANRLVTDLRDQGWSANTIVTPDAEAPIQLHLQTSLKGIRGPNQ